MAKEGRGSLTKESHKTEAEWIIKMGGWEMSTQRKSDDDDGLREVHRCSIFGRR